MHNFFRVFGKQAILGCTFSCLLSLAPPSQDVPLLKRIRDYWKEKDFAAAKKQISLYLNKHPNDPVNEELHMLLGDLYLQEGNFEIALQEYRQVQKHSLQDKIAYNLALCLYEVDAYQELLSLTKNLSSYSSLTLNQIQSIRYLTASALEKSKDPTAQEDAISLLEGCKDTPFAMQALAPLASLYLERNESHKAAECFIDLAKEEPKEEAALLFKASLLEAEIDPLFALELLQKVLVLESPYKSSAAYNALLLFRQTGQDQELVSLYEKYSNSFTNDHKISTLSCVGRSLCTLKEWEKAIPYFNSILEEKELSLEEKQAAQLSLLSCALYTQNPSLYESVWDSMEICSLSEELQMQTHLTYLDCAKQVAPSIRFTTEAKKFLTSYPHHARVKDIHLSLIEALYETKQLELAHQAIVSFVDTYPEEHTTHLLRLDLNCLSSLAEQESQHSSYRKLWIALSNATSHLPDFFTSDELESHLAQKASYLFLEGMFGDALDAAQEFISQFPTSSSIQEIHLLQTLCYLQDKESQLLFAMQAEKFLDLYPNHAKSLSLHLHLFNTYLSEALVTEKDLQTELLSKAASHLYTVFEQGSHLVQKENLDWLADHFYTLASEDRVVSLPRSLAVLEYLHQNNSSEETVYKLSKLFALEGAQDKQIALLEGHIPNASSSLQKYFLFDLAKSYGQIGESQKAIQLYDKIILSNDRSLIGAQSVLEQCKLLFAGIEPLQKTENNEACETILHRLKDLENERSIATEPLHIEAGLEYIHYKCSLIQDTTERKQKEEQLLTLCQENLLSSYDIPSLAAEDNVIATYAEFLQRTISLQKATTDQEKEEAISHLKELSNDPKTPSSLRIKIQTSLEGSSNL